MLTMKAPQFSLRDLLWLILVVAMGCFVWLQYQDIRRLERMVDAEQQQASEANRKQQELILDLLSFAEAAGREGFHFSGDRAQGVRLERLECLSDEPNLDRQPESTP